ncbi:MAG: sugar ABC transporter ATP-binding protein [Anaerolineales bacterium]
MNRREGAEAGKALLRARGLTKIFGGTVALSGVDIDVYRGEVVAVVGENGAGKSTLKNLLVGLFPPDKGTLELNGTTLKDFKAADQGIAAVHQEFSLFGSLSVAENICINELPGTAGKVDWDETRHIAEEHLDMVASHLDPDIPVERLSTGEQQLVEVAKALRQANNLLILDEPTTSLTEPERIRLFKVIRNLRERGLAMIFISHFIDEVYEISDRIVVLRDGERVGGAPTAEMKKHHLEELMVGRPLSELQVETGKPSDEVVLSVSNVQSEKIHDISFELHRGEILGLAGLMGAGRTELVEAIYGLRPARVEIEVDGRRVEHPNPTIMKELGVAFVPEDRRRHGLFGIRPLRENVTAAALNELVERVVPGLGFRGERAAAAEITEGMSVVHPGLEHPINELSGGNQQKALLGRWLAIEPKICILDDSTRGVDIGAKEEIHNLVGELARQGLGVIFVSSEMTELLQLAHRIIVLQKGKAVAEFDRPEFDPRRIIEAAASAQGGGTNGR